MEREIIEIFCENFYRKLFEREKLFVTTFRSKKELFYLKRSGVIIILQKNLSNFPVPKFFYKRSL